MAQFTTFNAPTSVAGPAGGRAATAEDFGGGGRGLQIAGKAGQEIGLQMQAAQRRTDDRNDTINRSRAFGTFTAKVNSEMSRLQTEGDPTDPTMTTEFGIFLKNEAQDTLSDHAGSPESKARLEIRLNELQAASAQKIGALVTNAGRGLVRTNLGAQIDAIAVGAGESGDIQAGFDAVADEVDEAAPALTPAEEATNLATGQSAVLTEVFNSRMASGDVPGAAAVLGFPGAAEVLGVDAFRKKRNEILKIERAAEAGAEKGRQKLQELSVISGVAVGDFTDEQRLRAANLQEPAGRVTLQDKVNEYTAVFGAAPSKDQMDKMAGTFIEDPAGPFGRGFSGLALARLSDDAPAFADGSLTVEDRNRYISAAAAYTTPIIAPNPDTGVLETRRAALPPAAVEAFTRAGIPTPGITQEGVEEVVEQPLAEDAPVPETTIFGDAELVSGPLSSIQAGLGKTPGIGDVFRPDQVEQARSRVKLLTRDLVRVLQSNPKFNEGERVSIERDIDLAPAFFDTKGAFRNRVVGIDDALSVRQKSAQQVLDAPLTGKAERIQAMREVNALTRFRIHLGAPPLVKSADEAKKLPEGSFFRTPDGRILRNKSVETE